MMKMRENEKFRQVNITFSAFTQQASNLKAHDTTKFARMFLLKFQTNIAIHSTKYY